MKFEMYLDGANLQRVYKLTVNMEELTRTKLYDFDRKLLQDCDAPDATIADKLLGLELIARRIEEAK